MIYNKLVKDHSTGRLYSSYLISTNDINQALIDIYRFLIDKIFCDRGAADIDRLSEYTHPDLFVCTREDKIAKNIAVDQIRELREFINKSSLISGYKVGIIYPADLMNDNAANSCLKMLEETPGQSLIILLTTIPATLLPTIRSRCARISHHVEDVDIVGNDDYQQFLQIFSEENKFDSKNSFIKEFAGKDRSRWLEFAVKAEYLLGKFIQLRLGAEVELMSYEKIIYSKFGSLSTAKIEYEYEQLSSLIQDVVEYDLDLKAGMILLLDHFDK